MEVGGWRVKRGVSSQFTARNSNRRATRRGYRTSIIAERYTQPLSVSSPASPATPAAPALSPPPPAAPSHDGHQSLIVLVPVSVAVPFLPPAALRVRLPHLLLRDTLRLVDALVHQQHSLLRRGVRLQPFPDESLDLLVQFDVVLGHEGHR